MFSRVSPTIPDVGKSELEVELIEVQEDPEITRILSAALENLDDFVESYKRGSWGTAINPHMLFPIYHQLAPYLSQEQIHECWARTLELALVADRSPGGAIASQLVAAGLPDVTPLFLARFHDRLVELLHLCCRHAAECSKEIPKSNPSLLFDEIEIWLSVAESLRVSIAESCISSRARARKAS